VAGKPRFLFDPAFVEGLQKEVEALRERREAERRAQAKAERDAAMQARNQFKLFTEDGRPATRKTAEEDQAAADLIEEWDRTYSSWSDVEHADAERFCIWCGIECESVAALETHEEECAP